MTDQEAKDWFGQCQELTRLLKKAEDRLATLEDRLAELRFYEPLGLIEIGVEVGRTVEER